MKGHQRVELRLTADRNYDSSSSTHFHHGIHTMGELIEEPLPAYKRTQNRLHDGPLNSQTAKRVDRWVGLHKEKPKMQKMFQFGSSTWIPRGGKNIKHND